MLKKIRTFLKDIFVKVIYRLYKYSLTIKNIVSQKKAKELMLKCQSVGYRVCLNGFDWHVTSPEHLIIGNNVHVGDGAYLNTDGGLIIGDNTHISRRLTVYTVNHNYKGKRLPYDDTSIKDPVFIGDNVWIGMNVSITPGVKIGEGAIIGMGSVVSRDVKPFEIVGLPKVKTLKERNKLHYNDLNDDQNYGGSSGRIIDTSKFYNSYLDISSKQICFVLGTGRCGSKSIATNLNKHHKIRASHEEIRQCVRLSTEYAHGKKSFEQAKDEIVNIFHTKKVQDVGNKIFLHSDQRFWNLVPILSDIFPEAKFIHLIRDGRDTIRSMYARNWFVNNEFEVNKHEWAEFRLNGYLADVVSKEKWENWGSFERCCWYWSYVNESIDRSLSNIDDSFLVNLETLDQQSEQLLLFLGVERGDLSFERYNSVKKKNLNKYNFQWNSSEEELFQEIAGKAQKKFYGTDHRY